VPRLFLYAVSFPLIFCVCTVLADDIGKKAVSQAASVARIGQDIKYLASDELKGRQPGTPEMKLAEDYIVEAFKDAGLKPGGAEDSYLQPFDVIRRRASQTINPEKTHLQIISPDGEDSKLNYEQHFVPMVYSESYLLENRPVVFVGYGINASREHNYNEYRDINVEGKVVILIRGEPQHLFEYESRCGNRGQSGSDHHDQRRRPRF